MKSKSKSKPKNGTRVTVSKAALDKVASLGAAHHSALKDLKETIARASKKTASTSGKKRGKKTGKKRGKKAGKKRAKR